MSDHPPPSDPSVPRAREITRPWASPDAAAEMPAPQAVWTAPPPPPPTNGWGSPTPGWGGTAPPAFGPPPPPPPAWIPSAPDPINRARIAMGLGAVLLLAVVGVVAFARSSGDDRYADEWDPRVVELVEFVERERGLDFEQPVHVDFLSADEYTDAVLGTDLGGMGGEQEDSADDQVAFLRALGLAEGDLDLVEAGEDMADAGTLAFYNMISKRVVVRGEELTTDVEVTLVHELTHALQDQHFDLTELQEDIGAEMDLDAPDLDAFDGFTALVEGDAVRIENAYIAALSEEDLESYIDSYNGQASDVRQELDGVPQAMYASMLVPYQLGNPLVELIAADGGNSAVDDAFDQLPATGEHLFDPRAYFDDEDPSFLVEPRLPTGADPIDEGTVSAVDLYLLLAERIDPLVALQAADGWGNGRYVSFEDDEDRICVRFSVDGDSAEDADELGKALGTWVDEAPNAADSKLIGVGAQPPTVHTCDPGADGPAINDRALDVLMVPVTRSQLMLSAVEYDGLDVIDAWDVANCSIDRFGYQKVLDFTYATDEAESEDLFDEFFAINEECLGEIDA